MSPLTFLGQHGDEGTDELIVVVGPSLVVNLWEKRMKTVQPTSPEQPSVNLELWLGRPHQWTSSWRDDPP